MEYSKNRMLNFSFPCLASLVVATALLFSCTGNAKLDLNDPASRDAINNLANEKIDHNWQKQVIVGMSGSTVSAETLNIYLSEYELADKCKVKQAPVPQNDSVRSGTPRSATVVCPDAEARVEAEAVLRDSGNSLIVAPDRELSVQSLGLNIAQEPLSAQQWGLGAIQLQAAWDKLSVKTDRVVVAVIDSGIDFSHPEFSGKLVGGYDFVSDAGLPTDTNGHGTHVAGIIASHANRVGTVGVAPNAFIMPLKVIAQDGKGTVSNLLKAIRYAIDNGAHVINISLAFYADEQYQAEYLDILGSYVQYAASKGVLIVAAHGNRKLKAGEMVFPAQVPGVLSVGAVGQGGEKLLDYGSAPPALYAPGQQILSARCSFTYNGQARACPGVEAGTDAAYGYATGSSAAAAFVSGAAVLLKAEKISLTTINITRYLGNGALNRNLQAAKSVMLLLSDENTEVTPLPAGPQPLDAVPPGVPVTQQFCSIERWRIRYSCNGGLNSNCNSPEAIDACHELGPFGSHMYLNYDPECNKERITSGGNIYVCWQKVITGNTLLDQALYEGDLALAFAEFILNSKSLTDQDLIAVNNYMAQVYGAKTRIEAGASRVDALRTTIANFADAVVSQNFPTVYADERRQLVDNMTRAAEFEVAKREENPAICGGCDGNPVHISNGLKETNAIDLKIPHGQVDLFMRRRHSIEHRNNFSLGKGWFLNHDTRIMLGVKKDAALLANQAQGLYDRVQAALLTVQGTLNQITVLVDEAHQIQTQSQSDLTLIAQQFQNANQKRQSASAEKDTALFNKNQALSYANSAISKLNQYEGTEEEEAEAYNKANTAIANANSYFNSVQSNYNSIVNAINLASNATSGLATLVTANAPKIAEMEQKQAAVAALVNQLDSMRSELLPLVETLRADAELAAQLALRNKDAIDPANSDEQLFGNGYIKWIDETGTNRFFHLNTDGTGTPLDEARNAVQNKITLLQNPDLTYTVRTVEGTIYRFGTDGLIRSKSDSNGNVLNYHYTVKEDVEGDGNPKLRLSYIEDNFSRKTSFIYEANFLKQVLDPIGRTVKYSYANGKLDKVSDPAEQPTFYAYSDLALTQVIDRNGSARQYEYATIDNMQRVVRELDPLGKSWVFQYDFTNHITDVTNRRGFTTRYVNNARGSTLQKIYSDGTSDSFEYDSRQNLTRRTDASGNSTFFEYNTDNLPVKITHSDGAIEYLAYDNNGKVIQSTDATGAVTRIFRDAVGNPTEIRTPVSTMRQLFDASGRLLQATDGNGRNTTYTYDNYGNLKTMRNPEGGVTNFEFDVVGRLVSKREPDGAAMFIEYDLLDRPVRVVNALSQAIFFAYLPEGQLRQKVEPGGRVTRYGYDVANQLISVIEPGDVTTTLSYDENGNVRASIKNGTLATSIVYDSKDRPLLTHTDSRFTRYTYDATGHLLTTVNPLGFTTSFAYDVRYRMTTATDALQGVSRFEYDVQGRITAAVDAMSRRTSYTRDAVGRVTAVTDAQGNRMTATYDANGNITHFRDQRGSTVDITYNGLNQPLIKTDALGQRTRYGYDNQGRLRTITEANSAVTVFDYDPLSRLIRKTNAEGEVERTEYDANGNVAAMIDGTGARNTLAYDERNRLVRVQNALGFATTMEYDKFDRRTAITNAENERTEFTYDKIGNLTRMLAPGGFETSFKYDKLSRVTDKYDAMGRQTQYRYDALNRLNEVVDALGGVTRYGYDATGNLKRVTDANGNSTDYFYDTLNRLTEERNALNQSTFFNYDAAGNLTRKTNADYSSVDYRYDPLNRPTERQYSDGRVDTFIFDSVNNLVTQKNPDSEESYEYDRAHRVTRVMNVTLGRSFDYGYDLAGRMTRIGNPKGAGANLYSYDAAGRLVQSIAAESDGRPNNFTYDRVGRLRQRELANGTIANYDYDANGRLSRLRDTSAGATLVGMDFQYDPAGNITSIARDGGRYETMSYDNNDRLASYARNGKRVDYTYDAMGNRVREFGDIVTGNADVSNTFNQLNQLVRRQSLTEGATQYEYDARGNRVLENAAGQRTQFSYSLENQLTKIKQASGDEYTYRYDAVGRRTYKSFKKYRPELVNGGVGINDPPLEATHMLYDRRQVLYDMTDAKAAKALYHYLPQTDFPYGSLISMKSFETPGVTGPLASASIDTLYYHSDHLGTTQKMTDRTGAVRVNYDHDAWGNVLSHSGDERSTTPAGAPGPINLEPVNRYTYTSKEHEFGTKQTHIDARVYHAKTGQFKQRDPYNAATLQLPVMAQGLVAFAAAAPTAKSAHHQMKASLYGYVSQNPLRFSDPYGFYDADTFDSWFKQDTWSSYMADTKGYTIGGGSLPYYGSGYDQSSDGCYSWDTYFSKLSMMLGYGLNFDFGNDFFNMGRELWGYGYYWQSITSHSLSFMEGAFNTLLMIATLGRIKDAVTAYNAWNLARVLAAAGAGTNATGNTNLLNAPIRITQAVIEKIVQSHTAMPTSIEPHKSKFFGGVIDVINLIRASTQLPANIVQWNGNIVRVVQSNSAVGVARGAVTNIYTVVTNAAGELVTAFPGSPDRYSNLMPW